MKVFDQVLLVDKITDMAKVQLMKAMSNCVQFEVLNAHIFGSVGSSIAVNMVDR